MSTAIHVSAGLSGKVLLTRILLSCGILSSLLYIAMNIFIPLQYAGYSSSEQTISEISAIGVPTRTLWVTWGFPYTLLMAAFGWGIRRSAEGNRPLKRAAILLMIYGIIGLAWPLFPMHQREVLAAGGGNWSDTMHIVFSFITVLLMLMAMGFGAASFGKVFRFYSIATILLLLVFGVLTGLDAPRLQANLPTPWLGVWERIMINFFLLWVVVIAFRILRRSKHDH